MREASEVDRRWHASFDLDPEPRYVLDLDGLIVDANPAFRDLVARTDLAGQDLSVLVDDADRRRCVEDLAHLETDRARTYEVAASLPDGARRCLIVTHLPITASGRPTGVLGHLRDVTEQRAARRALEDLQLSRSLQRVAGRKARVGGWAVELPERKLIWSDEVFELLDATPETTPTLDEAIAAYPVPYREPIRRAIDACIHEGRPFELEAEVVTFAGRRLRVLVAGEARRDDEGAICEVLGAFQDISELAAAHARTAETSQQLATTLESMTDALYVLDPDWRFSYANRRATELLERDRTEMLGAVLWEAFPEVLDSELFVAYERARRERETVVLDSFHYPPLQRWFEINVYPSGDGLAVYFRDITERHRTQLELAEREARVTEQAALLDNARDAIMVWDLDERVRYWNRRAERLYGHTASEALGERIRALVSHDDEAFAAATEAAIEAGEWVGELVQETRAGQELTVEARWTLVRGDRGEPRSVMAISTDVTERKRLETQFLRAQRMESLGTLAGGIAHDLNNVLAPVMMSIELLKLDEDDPRHLELLQTIESSTQRGADMIKQVLSFARGVEGVHAELEPGILLRDVGRILRDTLPRNIRLQIATDDDLWAIIGESTQLHQVLVNLAINARDAMPDGGTLSFVASNVTLDEPYAAPPHGATPGPHVRIRVEDDGVGMPPDVVDRIFDPFYTTKPQGEGTGLGLSTSLAIVESHEGSLRVSSEPGIGTTFDIYLPAASAEVAGEEKERTPELPRGNGEVVLVVDDEAAVREITRQTLEAFGYQVLEAVDGAQAVRLFRDHLDRIDLVLTDMMMPVMDGPTTIRAILDIDPDATIVAASGLNANDKVAKAADAGVTNFLPKPYTAQTLVTALRDALQRPG